MHTDRKKHKQTDFNYSSHTLAKNFHKYRQDIGNCFPGHLKGQLPGSHSSVMCNLEAPPAQDPRLWVIASLSLVSAKHGTCTHFKRSKHGGPSTAKYSTLKTSPTCCHAHMVGGVLPATMPYVTNLSCSCAELATTQTKRLTSVKGNIQ